MLVRVQSYSNTNEMISTKKDLDTLEKHNYKVFGGSVHCFIGVLEQLMDREGCIV